MSRAEIRASMYRLVASPAHRRAYAASLSAALTIEWRWACVIAKRTDTAPAVLAHLFGTYID